jgi:DNA polymerase I-like protein with 3'-5' exonuclease and polymerase domains
MYWWDHNKWLERQKSFTSDFWENYRNYHKGTDSSIAKQVKMHFKAASKYDRLARNSPAQGTSAIMTKNAVTDIFNWIVDNGYFGIIKCCALVHDETCWEYPKEIDYFPKIVKTFMEKSASKYCKSIEIPAEESVGLYWIH